MEKRFSCIYRKTCAQVVLGFLLILSLSYVSASFAEEKENIPPSDKTEKVQTLNNQIGLFKKLYEVQAKNQREFISQLSQELTAQNIRLQNIILVVSVLIGLMSVVVVVFEWKRRDEIKEQKKYLKEEINEAKQALKNLEEDIRNRFEADIRKKVESDLGEKIDSEIRKTNEKLGSKLEKYDSILKTSLLKKTDDYELRLLTTEEVKNSLWSDKEDQMLEKAENNNLTGIVSILTIFQKETLALYQLISSDENDIFTGIGTFLDIAQKGKRLPATLGRLLELLEKQGRFQDIELYAQYIELKKQIPQRRNVAKVKEAL
jgi:predicted PurR-regulated permease PerM